MLHFHSSVTAGSAFLIRARICESISPRQPLSSLILSSINRDGDSARDVLVFFFFSISNSIYRFNVFSFCAATVNSHSYKLELFHFWLAPRGKMPHFLKEIV